MQKNLLNIWIISETSVSFESGFGRFVPVRPQPRILPINIQNREGVIENNEDNTAVSVTGYSLHPYPHAMTNGNFKHLKFLTQPTQIPNLILALCPGFTYGFFLNETSEFILEGFQG